MISRIIEARPERSVASWRPRASPSTASGARRPRVGCATRDNLARLDDIRMELGERIVHLEAQAAVAQRLPRARRGARRKQQLLWLVKRNEARRAGAWRPPNESTSNRIEADSARLQELETSVESRRDAPRDLRSGTCGAERPVRGERRGRTPGTELQHLGEARKRLKRAWRSSNSTAGTGPRAARTLAADRALAELADNAKCAARRGRHLDRRPPAGAGLFAPGRRRDHGGGAPRARPDRAAIARRGNQARGAMRALEALQQRRGRLEWQARQDRRPDEPLAEREGALRSAAGRAGVTASGARRAAAPAGRAGPR